MKFLDRILPTGGSKKSKTGQQAKPAGRKAVPAKDPEAPSSRLSLDIPDLTGMNEKQRREALINHAMKVRRARVALVQNLDERSQKILRMMAMAMASKMDKKIEDTLQARVKAREAADRQKTSDGDDLQAAMKVAQGILGQRH